MEQTRNVGCRMNCHTGHDQRVSGRDPPCVTDYSVSIIRAKSPVL